jgi:hypothetical protein
MPTQYFDTWTELKTTFEHDAGAKIATIEKKQAKQKVSGLREKDGVVRLKKPAEKSFLGTRESSGMESACKALDKATAADVDMKTRTKALLAYRTAQDKYIEVLLKAAKEEPYSLVTKEIDSLRKGMQKIAADFNKTYTQANPRATKTDAENVKTLKACKQELAASKTLMATMSITGATAQELKVIKTHLKSLRDGTLTQLVRAYHELGYSPKKAITFAESIHLLLQRLKVDKKLVTAKEKDQKSLKELKSNDVDALLKIVVKQGSAQVSDCDECLNLCALVKKGTT